MSERITISNNYAGLLVSGPDATTFLQGQLTCDVNALTSTPLFAGYCNHKGRLIANFWIKAVDEGFALILPSNMFNLLEAPLKKFGAFSKIELTRTDINSFTDNTNIVDDTTWHADNLTHGRVYIYPQTQLLFTPQMINLEKWGGVSFSKGCYVGQEIIARTQNLGKLKRHLYRASSNALCAIGDDVLNKQNDVVGKIVEMTADNNTANLLAVIEDRAVDAVTSLTALKLV